MAKGSSGFMHAACCKGTETLVNTGELWLPPAGAESRVRRMQAKLHLWAAEDPGRRFDDLFNLIYHPDFLAVAWQRVSGNKGSRTPGVDRVIPAFISDVDDVAAFLGTRAGSSRRARSLPCRPGSA